MVCVVACDGEVMWWCGGVQIHYLLWGSAGALVLYLLAKTGPLDTTLSVIFILRYVCTCPTCPCGKDVPGCMQMSCPCAHACAWVYADVRVYMAVRALGAVNVHVCCCAPRPCPRLWAVCPCPLLSALKLLRTIGTTQCTCPSQ